ncbi:ComEC/Rec2 family competence protein [Thermotomaculum hydrothermale]|nr:ComEC/Rec2 family competence protein [Thermotomaculum hydrothermale]
MLRDFSFYLFLLLLPVPLIFLKTLFVVAYLLIVFVLLYQFKREKFFLFFAFVLLLFASSFQKYRYFKQLENFNGKVIECKGFVLKQRNSEFNSVLDIFIPVLKTRKGNIISFFRVFEVQTPLFYSDLRGSRVKITGILKKRKIYKNTFSSNYYYLLGENRLFYIKVKDKIFLKILSKGQIQKFRDFLFRDISNYRTKTFLSALVLGEKSSIDTGFKYKVKKLGIYHLFVLSGFHFGLFSLIFWIIVFFLPLRRRYKKVIVLLTLSFLLFIASFSSPSLRVYLMLVVYLVFEWDGINIKPLDAVGLAGIILLLINPFNVFNAGFLMSFLISGGIVISVREKSFFYSFLIIPFVAFSIMLPFCFYFFNYIPIFSPIYNLIIIPLIVFLFWIFVLNIFLSGMLGGFVQWYVFKLTGFLNFLPPFSFEVFPGFIVIVLSIVSIIVFFWKRDLKILFLNSAILILISIFIPKHLQKDSICFFDSGKPHCFLIFDRRESILVNTGDSNFISMCLKKELGFRGIKKLEWLILNDTGIRSIDRVEKLCEKIKIEKIVVPSKNLNFVIQQRLKWISSFFNIKLIVVGKREVLKLSKNKALSFIENGLVLNIKDKKIAYFKENSEANGFDYLLIEKIKTINKKSQRGAIIIGNDNYKKRIYFLEEKGSACFFLK